MKRVGHLWPQLLDRDNLVLAFRKALRGKRSRPDAQAFAARLDENLDWLLDNLRRGTVVVGDVHQFTIFDPKERVITAPSFGERVLHHAVMNVCEPVLERRLIADTFACRRGKGRLACVARAAEFSRQFPSFLKMDVRKYFDSVSHDVLRQALCTVFKEPPLLLLLDRILDSHHQSPGRGLPIGALTSQHFANFFLSYLDRWVKETVGARGYVRYMDDFVVWGDDSRWLSLICGSVAEFLDTRLELELKGNACINRTRLGMDFLGLRIFPDRLRLARRSKVRYARKLRGYEQAFLDGELSERDLQRRVEALTAFARTPGVRSWHFRRAVLEHCPVSGHSHEPGAPGRQLEQRRQELPVGEPQQERSRESEPEQRVPGGPSSRRAADVAS